MSFTAKPEDFSLTRTGLSLSLTVVWISLVAFACGQPGTSQSEHTSPSVTVAATTPTPDIRATVVAEITATAAAGHTGTPIPLEPTPLSVTMAATTPTPDIRATVVAEITATAAAGHTGTPIPSPTATEALPMPAGSFISPLPLAPSVPAKDESAYTPTPTLTPTPTPVPTSVPTLASMVEDVSPSVVQIVTPFGTGSGFVVRADGLVVTNAHVVGRLETIEVRSSDGKTYTGRVLGIDEVADIALLNLGRLSILQPVTLDYSDDIKVGEDVIAMGFPQVNMLGESPTITRGIVSAVRSSESEVTLIQTDAAINPGSSGGPLLSRKGKVIGINTSKLFRSDDGRPLEGIGLAVSANDIRSRLHSLELGESVFLDASSDFGTDELASAFNAFLPASFEEIDTDYAGISNFEEPFANAVMYVSLDPFQMILASTEEMSDLDQADLEDLKHALSNPETFGEEEMLKGFLSVVDADGAGILDVQHVGEWSIGIWAEGLEHEIGIGKLRIEIVMFLQNSHMGLAAIFYPPTTEPLVTLADTATVVERAILEYSN